MPLQNNSVRCVGILPALRFTQSRILIALFVLVGCETAPPADEPELLGRSMLTDADHEIPGPVKPAPPASQDGAEPVEDGPTVEMTILTEGRTHIGPNGVQITLEKFTPGNPAIVGLVFRTEKEESSVDFKADYGEGVAYGVLYKVDVSGEELTLRVEPTAITGPIDMQAAGTIALSDFNERPECQGEPRTGDGGVLTQSIGNTNGTVTVRRLRSKDDILCSTTVGLYTRRVIE